MADLRIGAEWSHDASLKWQHFYRDQSEAGFAAGAVHGAPDVEQLPTNWGIGFKRDFVERQGEVIDGTMGGDVKEPRFHFQIPPSLDFDVGMPANVTVPGVRSTAAAVADGIASILQRDAPDIVDRLRFQREEIMLSLRRQDHEQSAVA